MIKILILFLLYMNLYSVDCNDFKHELKKVYEDHNNVLVVKDPQGIVVVYSDSGIFGYIANFETSAAYLKCNQDNNQIIFIGEHSVYNEINLTVHTKLSVENIGFRFGIFQRTYFTDKSKLDYIKHLFRLVEVYKSHPDLHTYINKLYYDYPSETFDDSYLNLLYEFIGIDPPLEKSRPKRSRIKEESGVQVVDMSTKTTEVDESSMPKRSKIVPENNAQVVGMSTKTPSFIYNPKYVEKIPQYLIDIINEKKVFSKNYTILYYIPPLLQLHNNYFSIQHDLIIILLNLQPHESIVLALKPWVTNNEIFAHIFIIITKNNDSLYEFSIYPDSNSKPIIFRTKEIRIDNTGEHHDKIVIKMKDNRGTLTVNDYYVFGEEKNGEDEHIFTKQPNIEEQSTSLQYAHGSGEYESTTQIHNNKDEHMPTSQPNTEAQSTSLEYTHGSDEYNSIYEILNSVYGSNIYKKDNEYLKSNDKIDYLNDLTLSSEIKELLVLVKNEIFQIRSALIYKINDIVGIILLPTESFSAINRRKYDVKYIIEYSIPNGKYKYKVTPFLTAVTVNFVDTDTGFKAKFGEFKAGKIVKYRLRDVSNFLLIRDKTFLSSSTS